LSNLLKPIVSGINLVSNTITKFLGVNPELESDDNLSSEELKTLLQTSGMPVKQQKMLMGIFDMDYLSVNDVMVPRNKIVGIDLDDPLEIILKNLQETDFTYIPFFKDSIDNVLGFLTVNRKADFFSSGTINLENLTHELEEPIFIPENTSLNKQLANFQSVDTRVGLIVDEYGDIEGLITLRDILEVIVGEITSGVIEKMDIMPQTDGSYMIEGNVMLREINSRLDWNLPIDGPKTLSGLILETVQSIPEKNVGISIDGYRFETILIKDNVVKIAKAEKIEIDLDDEEIDKE
jgi:Mg2+/Co2+ transporter CorB